MQCSEHQRNKGSNRTETRKQNKHWQCSLKKSLRMCLREQNGLRLLLVKGQTRCADSTGSFRAAGLGFTQCLQIQHLKGMNGHCAFFLEEGACHTLTSWKCYAEQLSGPCPALGHLSHLRGPVRLPLVFPPRGGAGSVLLERRPSPAELHT